MTEKTPMMIQWHACKEQAGEALLLFQMGDFYEAFYDDAIAIAKALELTLTKRQEIPMAGIPLHTVDGYVDRLLGKGFKVAIAEQRENPKEAKGLVKREIVKIVSPGASTGTLEGSSNNYFVSLTQVGDLFGLAVIDLSTGEFAASEFDEIRDLCSEIARLRPSEILTHHKFEEKNQHILTGCLITVQENWRFEHKLACGKLVNHFKVHSLDGFGLKGKVAAINAAGALLSYLSDQLLHPLSHVQEITLYSLQEFLLLDPMTRRNLELTESLQGGNTLFDVLNKTETPMGARLLKNWIKQPLLSPSEIAARQDGVEELLQDNIVKKNLEEIRDIERLTAKLASGSATPKDLYALASSFLRVRGVQEAIQTKRAPLLRHAYEALDPLPEMTEAILNALTDEPPLRVSDGGVIRPGYHKELDELREIRGSGKNWIAAYQEKLRVDLGIKTLKVGYNRMFGYYIEVSNGQTDKMPDSFIRRQTLVNAERYISPELKNYESKVLTAEERIGALESELFNRLKIEISTFIGRMKKVAHAIAYVDALRSLAEAASTHGYCRPHVDEESRIDIQNGRHPSIEYNFPGRLFTPNDTHLTQEERLLLITGPNMAGKSTYIRQVALIAILAQIGSFVPASSAKIGIVDKVFARIGASDDLSKGQSTFMVEMTEAASILHNATDRSLVILDEIGRGTSTYDGISIAWAIAEYLLTAPGKQAKTLFATHYFELTKLEEMVKGAINYTVSVQETSGEVLFLHKIIRGSADRSYGIHVARLAGMPTWVLSRSGEIQAHLEEERKSVETFKPAPTKLKKKAVSGAQLTLFN